MYTCKHRYQLTEIARSNALCTHINKRNYRVGMKTKLRYKQTRQTNGRQDTICMLAKQHAPLPGTRKAVALGTIPATVKAREMTVRENCLNESDRKFYTFAAVYMKLYCYFF